MFTHAAQKISFIAVSAQDNINKYTKDTLIKNHETTYFKNFV